VGKNRINDRKKRAEGKLTKSAICGDIAYDIVTKDKFYAGSILRGNGYPTLADLGVVVRGELLLPQQGVCDIVEILSMGDELVVKNTILEASEGVLFLNNRNSRLYINGLETEFEDLRMRLSNGIWIIQKKYTAHKKIKAINASALNVLRIVTAYNGRDYVLIGGFQGFATNNASTDSWSEGSIYVGIDFRKQCLKKYGLRSPWHEGPGLYEKHPDSKIIFEGYPIPFIREARDMCLSAHRLFYTNVLLGWDVAITQDGPVIVEVNEKPGMNVLQCLDINTSRKLLSLFNDLERL